MGQEPRDAGQELDDRQERTPEQGREEIEQTREELGDTVAALAYKTDVKAQAKQAADETRAAVSDRVNELQTEASTKKDTFTAAAREATPESVGDAGTHLARFARRHRTVLLAVAGFGVGLLVGRRWR